jgi:hypothetical protein
VREWWAVIGGHKTAVSSEVPFDGASLLPAAGD